MLYALNNKKLVVRDIENFSKENSIAANKPHNKVIELLKSTVNAIGQLLLLYVKLNSALRLVRSAIKNDYQHFSDASYRDKEDILIKWEKLARTLNDPSRSLPNGEPSIFTRAIERRSNAVIYTVNNFIYNLKLELYPNINEPLSQEYLKELSKKFAHLPKEMLADMISDEQTEIF